MKFKKILKRILHEADTRNTPVGVLYRNIIRRKRNATYMQFASLSVEPHLVLFESFKGNKYADSPKMIYEYMLGSDEFADYRFIWCLRDSAGGKYDFLRKNPRTEIVRWGSEDYYRAYAMAAYWFVNTRIPDAIGKKDGQKYIQCWHGTPLKKLGCDITSGATESPEVIKQVIHKDVRRYDYLVSPSRYYTEKMSSALDLASLGMEDIVIETGYPRNDPLANSDDNKRAQIRQELGIADDKKVILYAPTYREDNRTSAGQYLYSDPLNMETLAEKLGSGYMILLRTHHFIRSAADKGDSDSYLIDVTDYPEINDLFIAADILVTDYSSVFYDYCILNKPIIFYMYDLEHYRDTLRGLYMTLEELPGPVETEQTGLAERILSAGSWFAADEWKERYSIFKSRVAYLDDGHASQRVVDRTIKK